MIRCPWTNPVGHLSTGAAKGAGHRFHSERCVRVLSEQFGRYDIYIYTYIYIYKYVHYR